MLRAALFDILFFSKGRNLKPPPCFSGTPHPLSVLIMHVFLLFYVARPLFAYNYARK